MAIQINRRTVLGGGVLVGGLSLVPGVALAKSDRVESLIARMTLAEKAGQLSCFSDQIRTRGAPFNPGLPAKGDAAAQLAKVRRSEVGMLFNGAGYEGAKAAQDAALSTRLAIPLIFAGDVLHGAKTVFPVPLAEACSFDPELCERTARAAALESTALAMHWTFAPMIDIARDQRWGRVVEGAGEDPYLSTELALARIRGFQGDDLRDPTRMAACAKHFAGYGAVSGGMEYNFTEISPATLNELHLAPFEASVKAGVATLMSGFNDIDGVPASANEWLLSDLLRGKWGFGGMVVGDYLADQELTAHGFAADGRDAAKKAFNAGMDMSMQSNLFNEWLPDLVESGEVSLARLDEAVRRVLHLKEAVGLFDNPYRSIDRQAEATSVATPAMQALSREAGARSIVLLKNEGNLLPLPAKPGRIALIGPMADDRLHQAGPWSPFVDRSLYVTLSQALEARGLDVSVTKGADFEKAIDGGLEQAAAAAQDADVVLLFIGESARMSGEAESRTEIVIPEPQMALAEAVASTGKPVVVLLRHGRALALHGAVKDAPAILATWFLGTRDGEAIADVLFGDVNPSAKLAVSFPHESGQQPFFYNHKRTGRPATSGEAAMFKAQYREAPNAAAYPFGYGLSYTSFTLSDVKVPGRMDDRIEIAATVKNTGQRAGAQVVQLYVHDVVATRTRPVRELKRFARVYLEPGQSRRVRFSLERKDLRFWDDGEWTIQPGTFHVWVADSSVSGERYAFELF